MESKSYYDEIEEERLRFKIEDYRHMEDFGWVTMTIGAGVTTLGYPSAQPIVGIGIIFVGLMLVCVFGWKKDVSEHELLNLLGGKTHPMSKRSALRLSLLIAVVYWVVSLLVLYHLHCWPFYLHYSPF